MDPTNNYLLIAFQGGLVQIYNVYSGAVLYNKKEQQNLNLGIEVANLAFFNS